MTAQDATDAPGLRRVHALLDRLTPGIRLAADAAPPGYVVVAGERAGLLRLIPAWAGRSPYVVAAMPRELLRARLRWCDEPEAAEELAAPFAPGSLAVLVVTDERLAVVELAPVGGPG